MANSKKPPLRIIPDVTQIVPGLHAILLPNDSNETMNAEAQLAATLTARNVRRGAIKVIESRSPKAGFGPPGTISLLIAAQGSSALHTIAEAITNGDTNARDQALNKLADDFAAAVSSKSKLFQSVDDIPVLGEVRYRGKTLKQGMFPGPGYEVAMSIVPYNGADLQHAEFHLLEYHYPGGPHALEGLIILNRPTLSDLEKEILARVTSPSDELHIGESPAAFITVVFIVAAAVVAVADAVVHVVNAVKNIVSAKPKLEAEMEEKMNEYLLRQTLEDLDPQASAAILLHVRKQLLDELASHDANSAARTILRARAKATGLPDDTNL